MTGEVVYQYYESGKGGKRERRTAVRRSFFFADLENKVVKNMVSAKNDMFFINHFRAFRPTLSVAWRQESLLPLILSAFIFFELILVKGFNKLIVSALVVGYAAVRYIDNSVCNGLDELVVVRGEQHRFRIADEAVVERGD